MKWNYVAILGLGQLPAVVARIILVLMLSGASVTSSAWSAPESGKPATNARPIKSLRKAEFEVGGASCVVCLRKIEHRLRQSPGVLKVEVSIKKPYQAVVFFDESKTDPHLVWMPLGKDGYTMNGLKVTPVTEVPDGLTFDTVKQVKKTDDMTVSPPALVAE